MMDEQMRARFATQDAAHAALLKEAEALARAKSKALGHTIGRFSTRKPMVAFRDAKCSKCGMWATYVSMMPVASLDGEAVTEICGS